MDVKSLKLKVTVCILTSYSSFHFKSNVLGYSAKRKETGRLSKYVWTALYVAIIIQSCACDIVMRNGTGMLDIYGRLV